VMAKHDAQLGAATLRLLAERPTAQILRELIDGPQRPSELEQRLPDVAHSALMRRLADLAQWRAVRHERVRELPPRAYYSLTDAGRTLLEIPAASENWARRWSAQTRQDAPGAWALRLLADEHNRAILLELADEQLGPLELERRLPRYRRSATRLRLGRLTLNGILARSEDRPVRYGLTAAAQELGSIAILAANWEWQWSEAPSPLTAQPRPPRQTAGAHMTPSLAQAEP
jgi:DNA-binding HxlR family transcriptional regulator